MALFKTFLLVSCSLIYTSLVSNSEFQQNNITHTLNSTELYNKFEKIIQINSLEDHTRVINNMTNNILNYMTYISKVPDAGLFPNDVVLCSLQTFNTSDEKYKKCLLVVSYLKYIFKNSNINKKYAHINIHTLRYTFMSWMNMYDKHYNSYEMLIKFQIFLVNHIFIELHNKFSNKSYTLELNKFSDLTYYEFSDTRIV